MARQLLRDVDPLVAEIIDGKHDHLLPYLLQAAQARQKNMFRPGVKVRVNMPKERSIHGQVGEVVKANTKTVTVGFGAHDRYGWEREYNISAGALEVVK